MSLNNTSLPKPLEEALNRIQEKQDASAGFVVQATPPEDTSLAWIDTSKGGVMKYYDESSKTWKAVKSVWG